MFPSAMQKLSLFVVSALILFVAWPVQAAKLPPRIKLALKQAQITVDHIGFSVQLLDRNNTVTSVNATAPFNPASVMKVVTTLAALDTLGPAYHFTTHVLVDGPVTDGVLTGNLIIQGSGDPALNLEHFHTLLHDIREKGVRTINGDVIIDNGFFAIEPVDPGAFDDRPLKPYNAVPSALMVNYNVLPLRLAPENERIAARLDPPGLSIENDLKPGNQVTLCKDWDDDLTVSRNSDQMTLSGRYPVACGDRTLWLSLLPATETAATLFKANWQDMGGVLKGRVRTGETPVNSTRLLDFDSPPLSDIVRGTNKFSNNVMAKMLFLDLGAARFGAPATWEKGRSAIQDWLKEKNLNMPELVLENGSGLSRSERISAASMARLLVWAAKQPLYYEFAASLPALGLEGTQRNRLKDTPLAGRAWLKSGSLDGIHNLAGYVLDAHGRRKAVVLFIRDATAQDAEKVQSAVLHWAMSDDK
jgi:D-alanyl-D-alanine carboxypeptidase/D-alanyl-D-alanine-endopeptidase (penicillin-binding protein 4)